MKKLIGINLSFDVSKIEKELLAPKTLLKLLKGLIEILEVKPVEKPLVKKISSKNYPHSGYTVVQIIKESHIVLNTWPEYNFMTIDIFTCKLPFDERIKKEIVKFLKEDLGKIKISLKIYKRFVEF